MRQWLDDDESLALPITQAAHPVPIPEEADFPAPPAERERGGPGGLRGGRVAILPAWRSSESRNGLNPHRSTCSLRRAAASLGLFAARDCARGPGPRRGRSPPCARGRDSRPHRLFDPPYAP